MNSTSPPGPASPPALRLRRPGWRDTRLLIGLVLVAGSVVLGSEIVSAAAHTVPVYVAAEALAPGDAVRQDLLAVREVRLAESLDRYLRADRELPVALVAVRTVAAGELVPLSAVAPRADLSVRPVGITPRSALPSGVVAGSTVDLWYVPATPVTGFDAAPVETALPYQLAAGLTVAEVTESGSTFAVGGAQTVQVLVPVNELARVLAALSAEGAVELVHVPGAGG